METLQSKIKAIANGTNVNTLCDYVNTLCNIEVNTGKVLIASKHIVSPLLVTSPKEMDNDIPVAVYCIAVSGDENIKYLGKEIVLDLAYGGKGISMNAKISNNDKKLIDILGGMENIIFDKSNVSIKDRTKIELTTDNKVEFWDINLINMNQIGGIVY